jgi:hypothetical protein
MGYPFPFTRSELKDMKRIKQQYNDDILIKELVEEISVRIVDLAAEEMEGRTSYIKTEWMGRELREYTVKGLTAGLQAKFPDSTITFKTDGTYPRCRYTLFVDWT